MYPIFLRLRNKSTDNNGLPGDYRWCSVTRRPSSGRGHDKPHAVSCCWQVAGQNMYRGIALKIRSRGIPVRCGRNTGIHSVRCTDAKPQWASWDVDGRSYVAGDVRR